MRGTVFKLAHGNGWAESRALQLHGGSDGGSPENGVAFDSAGNLYGTTNVGGSYGYGTVYELSPSGRGWTETTLYSFTGADDGKNPIGSVAIDAQGNLYGTASSGGSGEVGTAWELSPSNGWLGLHSFALVHRTGIPGTVRHADSRCGWKHLRDIRVYRQPCRLKSSSCRPQVVDGPTPRTISTERTATRPSAPWPWTQAATSMAPRLAGELVAAAAWCGRSRRNISAHCTITSENRRTRTLSKPDGIYSSGPNRPTGFLWAYLNSGGDDCKTSHRCSPGRCLAYNCSG